MRQWPSCSSSDAPPATSWSQHGDMHLEDPVANLNGRQPPFPSDERSPWAYPSEAIEQHGMQLHDHAGVTYWRQLPRPHYQDSAGFQGAFRPNTITTDNTQSSGPVAMPNHVEVYDPGIDNGISQPKRQGAWSEEEHRYIINKDIDIDMHIHIRMHVRIRTHCGDACYSSLLLIFHETLKHISSRN